MKTWRDQGSLSPAPSQPLILAVIVAISFRAAILQQATASLQRRNDNHIDAPNPNCDDEPSTAVISTLCKYEHLEKRGQFELHRI